MNCKLERLVLPCGVTLYQGDCLEILPSIGQVDAILTDPPYGVSYQSNMRKNKFSAMANDDITDAAWLAFGARSLKVGGMLYCFSRWDVLGAWKSLIEFFGLSVRSCLVWDKGRGGMGDLVGGYAPSYESVLVAARGRNALKSGRRRDVISCPPHSGGMVHPTQKPVDLFIGLVKDSTEEGETILDPFMGSGTTGIACIRTGRKFIGIEKDPEHFETARKRIEAELAQGDLFRQNH